ncbi:MAG TPA: TonB-dependent receptor, partial [Thermoanaerobaculia bacterium]|nr:TonB-dependent receptor [Thermoanaerobaculia bacterium]
IAAFGKEGVEIEEAYARSRRLPAGLAIKLGKFYSDIGYFNKQHPHQWDFVDQGLPYAMLLGGALNDVGVQLTWLPKSPIYLLLGVEAFQGENAGFANILGPDFDPALSDKAGPRLFTGFAKVAPDLGFDNALQIGVFGGRSSLHQEESAAGFLEGTAWFAGTDWVFKHDAPHFGGRGDFVLQAEYIYRDKNLDTVASADPELVGKPSTARQDGFYVQGKWGFASRWTINARYDAVGAFVNEVDHGDLGSDDYEASRRISAALTFNPTEFSRLRAQFSRGDAAIGSDRVTFNQFFLQYQLSLGVHGAHKF